MKMFRTLIVMATAAVGMAVSPALAVPTDTFEITVPTSGSPPCSVTNPCGTITVAETSSTDLTISVSVSPFFFAMTGAGQDAQVAFNVPGFTGSNATLDPPTGWESSGPVSINASINQTFDFAITCTTITGCKNGLTTLNAVTFDLKTTTGNFDSCFTAGANCFLFEVDLGPPTGPTETNTCATGATCVTTQCVGNNCAVLIPEPTTVAIFGAGVAGVGAVVRRRRRKKPA